MTKKIVPNKGMIDIEVLSNPSAFKSKVNLDAVPKFNKISWIKENVKTLGVHHGYNVDNDKIWKDIINRMKNCIQVWKEIWRKI
jgi:hypothetical protein